MPMETGAASLPTGIRPVQQTRSTSDTAAVTRREGGGSPFTPQTNVSIQNSVADMAGILAKIAANQDEAAEVMPQQIKEMVENVMRQAFSLETTLSEGLSSTIESQRFSFEQLATLSRILMQLGGAAEKSPMTEMSSELQAFMKNLRDFVARTDKSFEPVLLHKLSFQLLNDKDFAELPNELQLVLSQAVQMSALPLEGENGESFAFLKQLIKSFMPTPTGTTVDISVTGSENEVPGEQNFAQFAEEGSQAETMQNNTPTETRPNAQPGAVQDKQAETLNRESVVMQNGNAAEADNEAMTTSRAENRPGENLSAQNEATKGNTSQTETPQSGATKGETMQSKASQNEATQSKSAQSEAPQGKIPESETAQSKASQTETPQSKATQSEATQGKTFQSDIPKSETTKSETMQSQATQNDAGVRQNASANNTQSGQGSFAQGENNTAQGKSPSEVPQQSTTREPQSASNSVTQPGAEQPGEKASLKSEFGDGPLDIARLIEERIMKINSRAREAEQQQAPPKTISAPLENTPKTMELMKNLASLLLKDANISPKDAELLQNFVNNKQPIMSEQDAKQLQMLLRLCESNVPASVRQAAQNNNMPELSRLWAFMQLCDIASLEEKNPRTLKSASRKVADFALAMRGQMEGDGNKQVEGQRSMNFTMPLYLGDNEQSYPAYIHVYDENKQTEDNPESQKETWVRICLLTENIGAVELTCRIYEKNRLDVRVFFSQEETVQGFGEYIPEFKASFAESPLELADIKVGVAGVKL